MGIISTLLTFMFIIGLIVFIGGIIISLVSINKDISLNDLLEDSLLPRSVYTSKIKLDTVLDLLLKTPFNIKDGIKLFKYEMFEVTQLNRIGNVNNQYVRVDGVVESEETFLSPLTGTETIITGLTIERRIQKRWKNVYNGKQSNLVSISDGSGSLNLNMKSVDIEDINWVDSDEITTQIIIPWDSDSETRTKYWNEHGHAIPFDRNTFDKYVMAGGLRITERTIPNETTISITGDAIEYANENGWKRELQSKENKPFQIGIGTKDEFATQSELRAIEAVIRAGASIIVASTTLYIILFILRIIF